MARRTRRMPSELPLPPPLCWSDHAFRNELAVLAMSRTGFEPLCRGLAMASSGPSAPTRQPVSGRVGGGRVASGRFRAGFVALPSLRRAKKSPHAGAVRVQNPIASHGSIGLFAQHRAPWSHHQSVARSRAAAMRIVPWPSVARCPKACSRRGLMWNCGARSGSR